MKRSRKSKGVSWAHGVNLSQVKLFSSDECPSKVGLKSPDHLQEKTPRMLHPYTPEFNDCPPGFEVTPSGNQLADLSCITLIKWKCPLMSVMNCNWCVAAGEESKEVESQKMREMRYLEAVYPRTSSIPQSATVSTDIEDEHYDDSLTPVVPVIPIEEDECEDLGSDSAVVGNLCTSSMQIMEPAIPESSIQRFASEKPTEKLPDAGVDVAAAAALTALAVLTKSMEQGSMIDTNLLIKIFSDPKMIQNLSNIQPVSESVSRSPSFATAAPISLSKPVSESVLSSLPNSNTIPKLPNGSLPEMSNGYPSTVTAALPHPRRLQVLGPKMNGNYSKVGAIPGQASRAPVSSGQERKDLNYFKNLIRQHGDERDSKKQKFGQDGNNHNHHNLNRVHEMKHKIQKQCVYFNGPRGCRNGVNCQFKHDITLENQNGKRMKHFGEVTGKS